jgi:predicted transcriptional regulator
MFPGLDEIKKRRQKLGLRQGELAKKSGVSQSLVAKIESGGVKPGYDNVKRIFEALYAEEEHGSVKANAIMTKSVVCAGPKDRVEKAIRLLREKSLSQLPVVAGGKIMGSVSEGTIIERIESGISHSALSRMMVEEIMEAPFPTMPQSAPLHLVAEMLRYNSAIIILGSGGIEGIITKADMLKAVKRD